MANLPSLLGKLKVQGETLSQQNKVDDLSEMTPEVDLWHLHACTHMYTCTHTCILHSCAHIQSHFDELIHLPSPKFPGDLNTANAGPTISQVTSHKGSKRLEPDFTDLQASLSPEPPLVA